MAQTLSDVSVKTKLKAITVLATAFKRWIPRVERLNVHINVQSMDAHTRDAVVLTLNTFARGHGYSDWMEYESDMLYYFDPVPWLGLQIIKPLSGSADDSKLKAVHALATVFEKWVPRDEYLSLSLSDVTHNSPTFDTVIRVCDSFAKSLDESYEDWSHYESELNYDEPVPMLGLYVIEAFTRTAG